MLFDGGRIGGRRLLSVQWRPAAWCTRPRAAPVRLRTAGVAAAAAQGGAHAGKRGQAQALARSGHCARAGWCKWVGRVNVCKCMF